MRDMTVKIEHIAPTIIKNEADLDERRHGGFYGMPRVTSIIQTRTSLGKTGHEVIEILSDSEDEQPGRLKEEASTGCIARTSGGKKEKGMEKPNISGNNGMRPSSRAPFDPSMFTEKSGTIWTDSDVTSFAVEGTFQVTKEVRVDRVEYLTDIPSVWPIPKLQSAFILDLQDDAKYLVHKKPGRVATPATPDFLIKNKVSVFGLAGYCVPEMSDTGSGLLERRNRNGGFDCAGHLSARLPFCHLQTVSFGLQRRICMFRD